MRRDESAKSSERSRISPKLHGAIMASIKHDLQAKDLIKDSSDIGHFPCN